jgi:hypothetical protein
MFYIVEGIIYILFLLMDMHYISIDIPIEIIKYSSVVLCFLYALYKGFRGYLVYALGCIIIADYYFLFTNDYKVGVLFFCFVQYFYSKRIYLNIPISICFLYLVLFLGCDIEVLGCMYAFHSVSNLVYALYHQKNISIYLIVAIFLLLLCDLCVALKWMHWYPTIIIPMIWFFYVPSLWCLLNVKNYDTVAMEDR